MSIEGEPRPAENFIGDMEFGITPESIQTQIDEVKEELAQIDEDLSDEDTPEKLRKYSEGRKASLERVLESSPDEIFRSLQEVYDLVHELEQNGLTKTDILQKINDEKPDLVQAIISFYGILRSQTWGYRLGQSLFASRIK